VESSLLHGGFIFPLGDVEFEAMPRPGSPGATGPISPL